MPHGRSDPSGSAAVEPGAQRPLRCAVSRFPAPSRADWRRGAVALLLVALGVSSTACGSGRAVQSARAGRSLSAYEQCLADHGAVALNYGPTPLPSGHPDRVEAAAFKAARQACAVARPAGGLHPGGLRESTRHSFDRCLRRHGVRVPSPARPTASIAPGATSKPSPDRGGMLAGLDRNDRVVARALAACRGLLSSGGGRPIASPGPTAPPGRPA